MRIQSFDVYPYASLDINADLGDAKEFLPGASGIPWNSLLAQRFATTQPGLGDWRIYAMHFWAVIKFDTLPGESMINLIGQHLSTSFQQLFGIQNVLSVRENLMGNDLWVHVLTFPLKGRRLTAEEWIKPDEKGGFLPKQSVLQALVDGLKCCTSEEIVATFNEDNKKDDEPQVNLISGGIDTSAGDSAGVNTVGKNTDPTAESAIDTTYNEELIYDASEFDRQYTTDMQLEKFLQLASHTISFFTTGTEKALYMQAQRGDISPADFLSEVSAFLHRNRPSISVNDEKLLLQRVESAVYGNYILEPLLLAEDISDIKVLQYNHVRVKCNGKRMTSNVSFLNEADYDRYIRGIALRNGLDLESKALHVFTDAVTNPYFIMRFDISTPLVNSAPGYYLTIRKIRKKKFTLNDLVLKECMPPDVAAYLKRRINKTSMVFCGKGGSGKTTMINTLIEEISHRQAGLIIQESDELFSSRHPDFMFQHVVPGGGGMPEYSLKELARNGLLLDLDYFIIGEIKGDEALYFLNAATTGHKCVCSVHAPSSYDAMDKLADYIMYASAYDKTQALYMLKELKTVVYLEDFKVTEIAEIEGWDNEKKDLVYKLVYKR